MKKTYCPECGAKMEYIAKAPNFCTNCGFALNSAAQSRNVGHAGETGEEGVEGLEVELENEYGDMEGLDVEIINTKQHSKMTIGNLMGTAPEGSAEGVPGQYKKRGRPKSKKRVLEELKDEAGSIKENQKEN